MSVSEVARKEYTGRITYGLSIAKLPRDLRLSGSACAKLLSRRSGSRIRTRYLQLDKLRAKASCLLHRILHGL
jgi:hypothetical protein